MNRGIAETYEEYLAGAKYIKGIGRKGCYEGLDYLEKYLNDNCHIEEFEDSLVFIQGHIKSIEQENTNLKQALNEIREYINNQKLLGYFTEEPYFLKERKSGKDILQIIDKVLGDDEK